MFVGKHGSLCWLSAALLTMLNAAGSSAAAGMAAPHLCWDTESRSLGGESFAWASKSVWPLLVLPGGTVGWGPGHRRGWGLDVGRALTACWCPMSEALLCGSGWFSTTEGLLCAYCWPVGTLGCWVGLEPKVFFPPPLQAVGCRKLVSPMLTQAWLCLVSGAFLWGRIIWPNSSSPLSVAVLQLRRVVEPGWPQERPTQLSGNYRLWECQRWGHRGLVKIAQCWSQNPGVLGLPLLLFPFFLVEAQRLFWLRWERMLWRTSGGWTLSFDRSEQEDRFLQLGEIEEPSQGKLEDPAGYLWIQATSVSFSLPQQTNESKGRIWAGMAGWTHTNTTSACALS